MTVGQRPTRLGWVTGLGWRSFAIAGTAAAIGVAALVALSTPSAPASRFTVTEGEPDTAMTVSDPLLAELARCRTLPADTDDARCRAAWEVNRRRFLGESRSYVAPAKAPAREPIATPPAAPPPAAPANFATGAADTSTTLKER